MEETALATLLHLLVFAYWLGGDLGAFVASFVVTDTRQAPAVRLAAARLLGHVDMAPRTALILTLPTGLTLASLRGWLELDTLVLGCVWVGAAAWLGLLWRQHVHPLPALRQMDLALRAALLLGLLAAAWRVDPLFLKAKFVLLALAVIAGLVIRQRIAPLGPALAGLAAGTTAMSDPVITRSLARARPLVVMIWMTLLAAAWLGLTKPM